MFPVKLRSETCDCSPWRLPPAATRVNKAKQKARPILELTKDTPTTPPTPSEDPQKTGSGSAEALGGKDAPAQTANDMSQSGEAYPGTRQGGETDKPNPAEDNR